MSHTSLFVMISLLWIFSSEAFPFETYIGDSTVGASELSQKEWQFKIEENSHDPILMSSFHHTLPQKPDNSSEQLLWEFNQQSTMQNFFSFVNFHELTSEVKESLVQKLSCTGCGAAVGLIMHSLKNNKSEEDIKDLIYNYCVTLKIQTPEVCRGTKEIFGREIVYIFSRTTLTPSEICKVFLSEICGANDNPIDEWNVFFPPIQKPIVIPQRIPKDGAPTFKVLQISDTHYDVHYLEGSNVHCEEPLCCRATSGEPASPKSRAGKWGEYRVCDTPKILLDNMLEHIRTTHPDIDYIMWTGDLPPHDIWNQTREDIVHIIHESVNQLKTLFPGVPILPALGNHESNPVNFYPPPDVEPAFSVSWLYDELDTHWRKWLPLSTSRTIRHGAFYSVLIRPGFRIISINTNYCSNKNGWLLLNSTDSASELQWLIYELQSAELSNEKVHIIGHIPPGYVDCLKVWSRNYYSIINRYESTVTAQFFGHTHFDEFEVFYDEDNLLRPISVAYVGPSVTPYIDLNPAYRIYYVDGDHPDTTRAVVDHETWTTSLREANLYGYPIWFQLYSARHAYGMEALRPHDWDRIIERMVNNRRLFKLYYKYSYRASPVAPKCDKKCRSRIICDLRSGRSYDRDKLCAPLV